MQIVEDLYTRGYLSRREIAAIQNATFAKIRKDKKNGVKFTFDDCRRKIQEFAKAKRKADRGRVMLQLATIHFTGIFNAQDIAYTLLYTSGKDIAVERAMQEISDYESKYAENVKAIPIIKRGISQVIPKGWNTAIECSSYNLSIDIKPASEKPFYFIGVEGAGNAYAFLTMLLVVRPMLHAQGIKFNFDTLETIAHVWKMGESKIAYGARGMSGNAMIESEKRSYKDYFAAYNLPDEIKATILDCLQESIDDVKYGVGSDSEGNSYNGLTRKPIPEKGLWVGAAKAA